jgi:hypothetical protein
MDVPPQGLDSNPLLTVHCFGKLTITFNGGRGNVVLLDKLFGSFGKIVLISEKFRSALPSADFEITKTPFLPFVMPL